MNTVGHVSYPQRSSGMGRSTPSQAGVFEELKTAIAVGEPFYFGDKIGPTRRFDLENGYSVYVMMPEAKASKSHGRYEALVANKNTNGEVEIPEQKAKKLDSIGAVGRFLKSVAARSPHANAEVSLRRDEGDLVIHRPVRLSRETLATLDA